MRSPKFRIIPARTDNTQRAIYNEDRGIAWIPLLRTVLQVTNRHKVFREIESGLTARTHAHTRAHLTHPVNVNFPFLIYARRVIAYL